MPRNRRTYEDYEELGRHLETAEEAVRQAQTKSLDMFGGLHPVTDDPVVTMDTRPRLTSHDGRLLDLAVLLIKLRSELAMDFRAEISESEVPPGKPKIPPPFGREGW